jgi:hypothetical protein
MDERLGGARQAYENAVFGGDSGGLPAAERGLDAVEADVALARGRLLHARFLAGRTAEPTELPLFERAAQLYEDLGDRRGLADALFWIGVYHQVVQGDDAAAVPVLDRCRELATEAGDGLVLSYALRHLAIAAHTAGRPDDARRWLEESTRLRRGIGFQPGVAANLIGLAYVAAGQDRRDDAVALIDEAAAIAGASGAHGVLRTAERARAELCAGRD